VWLSSTLFGVLTAMPSLLGFSDNTFEDHEDFRNACISLLYALKPYQSPGGARIKLPLNTGTCCDEVAAQLEGFARPLWAIGSLLIGECLTDEEYEDIAQPYIQGLANGTDPSHPEYWGEVGKNDQRVVEMEMIAFVLLAAPDIFFHEQTEESQKHITNWLMAVNWVECSGTKALWSRVLTNVALIKTCGIPYNIVESFFDSDLNYMERFYIADGWAADGIWDDDGQQADYYSGSFGVQVSQLLYIKFAEDLDPERCADFRTRAFLFADAFWRYFDEDGTLIFCSIIS
jgi:hypothetical protein